MRIVQDCLRFPSSSTRQAVTLKGHDRNMKHLMIILESFKAIHAHWPEPVRLEQGYIDEFRTMLIDNSHRSLVEKVELLHDEILEMHTEDSRAASFACGCDPIPKSDRGSNTFEWLDALSHQYDLDD